MKADDEAKLTYDIAERPKVPFMRQSPRPFEAVISTAKSGKAIRIYLNGKQPHFYTTALKASLAKRGYNMFWSRDPDSPDAAILVWANEVDGK